MALARGAVVAGSSVDERWRAELAARAGQHASLRVVAVPPLDAGDARALGRSLAIFQLGESGDGTHLLDAARQSRAADAHVAALAHFVAEEQEHARMLALVLDAMDVPRLSQHWSDRVFVLTRRARSLVTEVLVLLVAEVVALTYYSTLRDGPALDGLQDVFARIHADEVVHVDFHCETLPRYLDRFGDRTRSAARIGWRALVTGAAVTVAIGHGRAIRAAGSTRRQFVRRVLRDRDQVAERLFGRNRT